MPNQPQNLDQLAEITESQGDSPPTTADSQQGPEAEIQPSQPPTSQALEKVAEERAVLVKELGMIARNIGSLRTANLKHMKTLNDIPLISDKRSDLKKLLREEQDRIHEPGGGPETRQ